MERVSRKRVSRKGIIILGLLAICMLFLTAQSAMAGLRTRIVILPFYVEKGVDVNTGRSDLGLHYRRMTGFIENHLVRNGFEVIDPFAKDSSEKELSRVMERARDDSALACLNMAQRFAVDAVYIVWLKVKAKYTSDGYWKTSALLDGKGYDSGGRSLGANVLKTFKVTRQDFDEAVAVVEKEVGDEVGYVLTAWNKNRNTGNVVVSSSQTNTSKSTAKGVLANNIKNQERFINVRLDRANKYELVEIFGKVLNSVRGVVDTKRYTQRIIPDNPQACSTEWEVEISNTDPFRLQANMMKMIDDILKAKGDIRINGVPYRYTPDERRLMMGIMPAEATSRSIQFVIDRERARDVEFSKKYDFD